MEVLYRKYRPATFADVTGQDHVKTTLQNQIASGSISHAYLLTGPRGVGKTTVARLIAKAVNCETILRDFSPVRSDATLTDAKALVGKKVARNAEPCNTCLACLEILNGSALDVIEIDAASNTGVESVRENIIESVRFVPNKLKYKVYIIDEVHMLSTSAFNALLKTLEEPPAHALFILATTETHKVPATIISRCQRFDFKRLSVEVILERLEKIVEQEKISVDKNVLVEIARHADGGMRDAESMLGQVLGLGGKKITMNEASLVLPATNAVLVDAFVAALIRSDRSESLKIIRDGQEQGLDLPHFVEDVISQLRDKMMSGFLMMNGFLGTLVPSEPDTTKVAVNLIESLLEARRQMKSAKIVSLPIELVIVKACRVPDGPKVETREGSPREVMTIRTSEPSPSLDLTPVSTALGTVPVLDLEDVRRKWPEVFEQIKSCNATLPMVVQTGEVSAVDGDAIEMSFAYPVFVETINQDKNRKLLEQVFTRVLGRSVRIKAKHVKKEMEVVVEDLLGAFGGSVV